MTKMSIVDLILDRRDGKAYTASTAHKIVKETLRRDYIGIYTAFAIGDNYDAQDALCEYINKEGFNPDLKFYIRRMDWIV